MHGTRHGIARSKTVTFTDTTFPSDIGDYQDYSPAITTTGTMSITMTIIVTAAVTSRFTCMLHGLYMMFVFWTYLGNSWAQKCTLTIGRIGELIAYNPSSNGP